jgi:hypothetical protein
MRQCLSAVLKAAARHDATALSTHEPSLEEVFLRFYEPAYPSPIRREVVATGER